MKEHELGIRELPGTLATRAQRYFNKHNPLKSNDCFALTLAEDIEGGILLTGDGSLRKISRDKGIGVRGVFWVTDELEKHNIVSRHRLHDALQLFHDDDLVFLPKIEVDTASSKAGELRGNTLGGNGLLPVSIATS